MWIGEERVCWPLTQADAVDLESAWVMVLRFLSHSLYDYTWNCLRIWGLWQYLSCGCLDGKPCWLCCHDLDTLMLQIQNSSERRPNLVGSSWTSQSSQFYFVNVAYSLTFPKESRNVVIYQIWQCFACFRKDIDGLSDWTSISCYLAIYVCVTYQTKKALRDYHLWYNNMQSGTGSSIVTRGSVWLWLLSAVCCGRENQQWWLPWFHTKRFSMPRGTPKSLPQLISFGERTLLVQIPTICRPNTETVLSLAVNHFDISPVHQWLWHCLKLNHTEVCMNIREKK